LAERKDGLIAEVEGGLPEYWYLEGFVLIECSRKLLISEAEKHTCKENMKEKNTIKTKQCMQQI
jgi:hypothetical protein